MSSTDFGKTDTLIMEELSPHPLLQENDILRQEIREARKAAEITADLVVKQFEETERVLHKFQVANAQRKAVLDSATQISIIATNTQGTITVFNKGAENLLGYDADEIIGKQSPMLFHLNEELEFRSQLLYRKLDSVAKDLALFFLYASEGISEYQEWTYVHKTGRRFPVRMSIIPLLDAYGAIDGILFIALDVSEKKRSEKALRESERKYRLLMRNLPNVVYKGYLDGTIDFVDDKIEELTGYSRHDFASRKVTWFDLVHEDDLAGAKEIFIRALKKDHSYIREYRFKSKDGRSVWVQEGGQIIFGEDGEVDFVTGAFLDVTEHKLAERALQESEKNYRSLFNSGPNPIFVLDRNSFVIMDANPSAEETYGYSLNELVGRRFSDLGSSGVENLEKPMALELSKPEDRLRACVVSQKVRHFRKDKTPFYVRVTACPTYYNQRPAIIVGATDITEVIEKDAQLVQASKMTSLGQMSAGIAHELNQPLNAIKIGNEFLQVMVERGRVISPDNLHQVAREVSDQVRRASAIINRLRQFGRKSDLEKELVDINAPIRVVYGIIHPQLKLQNINVVLDLATNILPILAQSNRLEQVFFNLLTNASDSIAQKRETTGESYQEQIKIRTYQEQDSIVGLVSDTGVGIPDSDKVKIFDPFFTTKEVGKGMGLGLSIIYGIIKDCDGEIEVHSSPNTETLFKMTFPVASAQI